MSAPGAPRAPVRRAYADGRFGQLHYRIAVPDGGAGAARHPPLLCFHMSPNSGRRARTFAACVLLSAPAAAVAPLSAQPWQLDALVPGSPLRSIHGLAFGPDAMIYAGSVCLGVDSPIGPLYLGIGFAENRQYALYLKLGQLVD